jgi:hypothetical protein
MFKSAVRVSLLVCAVVFSISHAESQNVSNYRRAKMAANESSAVDSLGGQGYVHDCYIGELGVTYTLLWVKIN